MDIGLLTFQETGGMEKMTNNGKMWLKPASTGTRDTRRMLADYILHSCPSQESRKSFLSLHPGSSPSLCVGTRKSRGMKKDYILLLCVGPTSSR